MIIITDKLQKVIEKIDALDIPNYALDDIVVVEGINC